ncbi:MAG: penicillin acylase family protein, partial [Actinomycetota bacterium]
NEGYSPAEARRIFDDLRFAEDPEAPVTADGRFPWNNDLGPVDPAAVARPDDAAEILASIPARPNTITGPFGPIQLGFPDGASNALLVGAKLSESGRPLAVFGPQTGYWSPEILMEIDMHGPGIHARGAAFPGLSLYVLLGRGDGYAWSAASAGGDQVDVYAVELCDPGGGEPALDSTSYVNGSGKCEAMEIRELSYVAKPSAGGVPDSSQAPGNILVELRSERTDYGLVRARGTIKGKPVAFTILRSSYGGEVDSALTYVEMLDPRRINGPRDFQRAFSRFSSTFNWFYVDGRHIAYQLGGYHPLRARGVDPDLPVWGQPQWRWRGLLSFRDTPKAANPAKGYITSWNNKQAHGFRANDRQWSYGPVYR